MMMFELIATDGNNVAVVFPRELLAQVGMGVGDQVDITLINRTIVLRPIDEAERVQRIEEITKQLFTQRKSVYEALAEGAL
jgi:antitoxin component of MazEF toxin-antitoxin module